MTIDTAKLTANWKTTVIGLLGLGIAVVLALMALPPKASVPVIALAVMRAAIAFLQKDAGTVPGRLPDGNVDNLPAHEVPDDPKAKAVVAGE